MELIRNGSIAKIMETGATVRTAFCGPCFGAGDVPANNAFSIRHSTRNFPNREGSKVINGQIASVALMDARSIAATALNKGRLTAATDIDVNFTKPKYYFDSHIYEKRVYNGVGKAYPSVEIQFRPSGLERNDDVSPDGISSSVVVTGSWISDTTFNKILSVSGTIDGQSLIFGPN